MTRPQVIPASAYGEADHPPAPTPSSLPANTDRDIRCTSCSKLLIEFATRPYCVRCPRCKTVLTRQPGPQ